jgi:hypothetical protein
MLCKQHTLTVLMYIHRCMFQQPQVCNHCVFLFFFSLRENFSCTVHMSLYLYDISHILQPF